LGVQGLLGSAGRLRRIGVVVAVLGLVLASLLGRPSSSHADPLITVTPATVPNGTVGVPYTTTFTASGGIGPYTWTFAGVTPPGLSFGTNGDVSGVPTTAGNFSFTAQAFDANNFEGSASYVLNIDAADQTITFGNPGTQSFGTAPNLVATATSGLPVTFSSSTAGVCAVSSGGTLTFVAAGTCTINADQPGNPGFAPAPRVSQTFQVAAIAPGAPTIATATPGDHQVSVAFTPPASSGGAPITTYTATSSPGGVTGTCTSSPCLVGGLVNGVAYAFTVTATNSTGTGFASAASNAATPSASQVITFANPGTQNYGTAPTLTATASSGLPVTFASSTSGVCTVTSGGLLTYVAAGTCTIDADQSGAFGISPAARVSQSFTVNPVIPTAPVIGAASAGDSQASVAFAAPSFDGGAAITGYTATSTPDNLTGTCTSSPCVVTGLSDGTSYTFTVTATNPAGTGSASAASNAATPQASQTITFTLPTTGTVGLGFTLAATADSGLPVAYTVDASSTDGACTINGNTLQLTGAGSCAVDANQAGDAATAPATQVQQLVTVTAAAPPAGSTLALSNTSPTAQSQITLTANGLLPASTATFYLHSTPYLLGATTVDSAGVATLTVDLPAGFTGAHTVELRGTSAAGLAVDLTEPITILAATEPGGSTSPSPGSSPSPTTSPNPTTSPSPTTIATPNPIAAPGPTPSADTGTDVAGASTELASTGTPYLGLSVLVGILLLSVGLVLFMVGRRRRQLG
jgi:hypothetical protein